MIRCRAQVVYMLLLDRSDDGDPSNNDQGYGEYDPEDTANNFYLLELDSHLSAHKHLFLRGGPARCGRLDRRPNLHNNPGRQLRQACCRTLPVGFRGHRIGCTQSHG